MVRRLHKGSEIRRHSWFELQLQIKYIDDEIVIRPVDKGSGIVVMDRDDTGTLVCRTDHNLVIIE